MLAKVVHKGKMKTKVSLVKDFENFLQELGSQSKNSSYTKELHKQYYALETIGQRFGSVLIMFCNGSEEVMG